MISWLQSATEHSHQLNVMRAFHVSQTIKNRLSVLKILKVSNVLLNEVDCNYNIPTIFSTLSVAFPATVITCIKHIKHHVLHHPDAFYAIPFYPSARIGLEGYCCRLPGGRALPHTVTALPVAVLIWSWSNLVRTNLGAGSRTSSFMGDVAR